MSRIRECFKPRAADGWLLEADYNQLEIVALAYITGDPQLIEDLLSNKDLHAERAGELFNKHPSQVTSTERRYAKTMSFRLQYGAGAGSMAKAEKLPLALCKKFIKNYYDRYPLVKEWQDSEVELVESLGVYEEDDRTASGTPRRTAKVPSVTGRIYTFKSFDNVWKAGEENFLATQVKNYKVQGFATGDVMKIALGELALRIWNKEEGMRLVNTVHDSILVDCDTKDAADICTAIMEEVMVDRTTEVLENRYGITLPVPLTIECKVGKDWGNMS